MNDDCEAVCWIERDATEAVCTLPPGHPGLHWDQVVGWEW